MTDEWVFEKYYSLETGEVLLVAPHPYNKDFIFIKRRGKYYKRPKSIIGKTIAPYAPKKIGIGSRVAVRPEGGGETEYYEIAAPSVEYEYAGMGGAYYGAKTRRKESVDRSDDDFYFKISTESALAKKLTGLYIGNHFEMPDENGNLRTYVIMGVKNEK